MASSAPRNPTTWEDYEGRPSPSGSPSWSSLADEQVLLEGDHDHGDSSPIPRGQHHTLERRRSSVTNRLAAMADVGGVNSIRSFARSWQRAAGFPEVIPRRPSFVYAADQQVDQPGGEEIQYGRSQVDDQPPPAASLLRQHLEGSPDMQESGAHHEAGGSVGSQLQSSSARDDFRERERKALDAELASGALLAPPSSSTRSSIFAIPPHLAAPPLIGSYGSWRSSHYGTMSSSSQRPRVSIDRASTWTRGDEGDAILDDDDEDAAHGEHEPILVKEVKQGDRVVLAVEGQSTLPQSIFNSINAIIGVGLLSLPLAFRMSGWLFGLVLLSLNASVTAYTSRLLALCMDADPSLITYSDIAYISYGVRARIVVSALFTLELVAACVALVILFADSLDLLLPGVATVSIWKCVCAALILVLNALPLRWLSYTSIIGIFSTFCIVVIVVVDGIIKREAPGSLWEPATTYLLPSNWLALPLAYGLLASPWGAHSVFPSIYRDMRHPRKWGQAVKVTFSFSYVLDTCLAVIGILMFGEGIRESITSNIIRLQGYSRTLTILMCVFVTIIPLTKIPLNARPLVTTVEVLCGIHPQQQHEHHHDTHNVTANRRSWYVKTAARGAVRLIVVVVLLVISIAFPAFDSVCAFLGAALCTLISVILPIAFYFSLYWKDITLRERVVCWTILAVFSVLGTAGTVWTFLPKDVVGL